MQSIQDQMSAVQRVELRRRRRMLAWLVAAIVVLFVAVSVFNRFTPANQAVTYSNDEQHFKYGSIGSEPDSGLPTLLWKVLPTLYPEVFNGSDFRVFGFLYENDANGRRRDLPIGISTRTVRGIELSWMNCAVCHTGTARDAPDAPARVIAGMPSNNLDLHRFIVFVLGMAGDPRLAADTLIPAIQKTGVRFDWLDRLTWRYIVIPRLQKALLERRQLLAPLLAVQAPWGPGRVDTFNPYKLIQFKIPFKDLTEQERVGTADFPSIFNQRQREGMWLHWDGNNNSLAERNLSAALGAGVTEQSIDHPAIERVAAWLQDLRPPPSPYHPDAAKVVAGRAIYVTSCAGCHGQQDSAGYMFDGDRLGQVQSNAGLNVDASRLNSYTQAFRDRQLTLFQDDPRYHFSHFRKTDGYANLPLDGLWLRAPYLHNGSVPTLAALLQPPEQRPAAFVRGLDVLDPEDGGFQAPACVPGQRLDRGFCYDTAATGNGRGGHLYGTSLGAQEKSELLAYLLTF